MGNVAARVLLFLSVSGWAIVFVANHELLTVLRPIDILVLRFLGVSGAFLLILLAIPSKRPRLDRKSWFWLTLAGILAIPGSQFLVLTGQQFLSPALSGLVVTSSPAFAAVIAYRFLGERMQARQIIGVTVALMGVTTIILLGTGTGTEFVVANPLGASLIVVGQVTWAAYTVVGRKLAQSHDPFTMVAVAFIIGSLFFIPWIPDAIRAVPDLTSTERWWIFHLVVGGTLIPHVVWFTVLSNLRANETAVAMYLVPLYTVIASFLVLGERLRPVAGFGGLAIIIGVLLAQTRRQQPRLGSPSRPQAGATGDAT